jgi:hypothetical protein
MIFLFKKPKIVVDCMTVNNSAHEFFKIEKAIEFLPRWWKETPSRYDEKFYKASTIKQCSGFIELYKQGFILPNWSDLAIEVKEGSYQWQFSDRVSEIEVHGKQQWETYADPTQFGHIKLNSPWWLKTKSDIKFMFLSPTWNYPMGTPLTFLNGTVNYKYQHSTNVNALISLRDDATFLVPHGQPLAHIVPITEKEVELRHHLISAEELAKIQPSQFSFTNMYKERTKKLKAKESKPRCPFNPKMYGEE